MSTDADRIAELEAQVAQLTEQCAAARRELEAFSYAVSHDLRAPLRSLSGFSQALIELPNAGPDPDTQQKAQHYLNRIQQAARKLSDLIDALLSLSRISRADMQVRKLDFTQLCHEAADVVSARYPERKVDLVIAPNMNVTGDSRLLRTAVELLLDNAWKYSAARPVAAVSIGQCDDDNDHSGNVTYFVRDNGVGFDMAYAEKLFRPFQRLHAETQFAGLGVGLASVQRIVARHGGRTWAESQPDQGATIFISLPKDAANA